MKASYKFLLLLASVISLSVGCASAKGSAPAGDCSDAQKEACGSEANCELEGSLVMCLCGEDDTKWFDASTKTCKLDKDCPAAADTNDFCKYWYAHCNSAKGQVPATCPHTCQCPKFSNGIPKGHDMTMEDEIMMDVVN